MGKRRTRYSSSLAEDWIVSSPRTDHVATADISANSHTARGQSYGPADSYQGFEPTQGPLEADGATKRARYKKSLPSNWVASNSEDDPAVESPHLQPLRGYPSSPFPDFELYDAAIKPTFGQQRSIDRSTMPARNIQTSLPPQNDGEFVPPPAPTEDRKMNLPYRKLVHEQQGRSVFQSGSSLNSPSRAGQRSYVGRGPVQLFDDTTVSPPISARQSSPATTDSPSYGRDLPAKVPTISPSYST